MRISLSLLISLSLMLAACGAARDSSLNPVNWFGGSTEEATPSPTQTNPLIPESTGVFSNRGNGGENYKGTLVETVSSVMIERTPGGAIIRVEGIAAMQGVHDVRLVPTDDENAAKDGVLTYRLEGVLPATARPVGPPATRRVVAAQRLTDRGLQGVRTIRVEARQNAQVSRR